MEVASVSMDEWMDKKLWYAYTMGHYAATKKEEILPRAMTWVDLERMLGEVCQTEKD